MPCGSTGSLVEMIILLLVGRVKRRDKSKGDPVMPYWHEPIYRAKVWRNRDYLLHTNIPSLQYGHCNFTLMGTLVSFAVLVRQVSGEGLLEVSAVLPDASAKAEFEGLVKQHLNK